MALNDWLCMMTLWTPNCGKIMALNAWLWTTALNAKLWTMALNAKLNNGSECLTKNTTLNVKLKKNCDSKCQNEGAALNVELKEIWWIWTLTEERHDDSKCQIEDMTLNAELKKKMTKLWMSNWNKQRLWTSKWICGSERQNEYPALNAELK